MKYLVFPSKTQADNWIDAFEPRYPGTPHPSEWKYAEAAEMKDGRYAVPIIDIAIPCLTLDEVQSLAELSQSDFPEPVDPFLQTR